MNKLSIEECVKFGWNKFWERPWFFIGAYVVISIFNINFQTQINNQTQNISAPAFIALIFLALGIGAIRMVIRMGEKRLLLNAYKDLGTASVKDLWTPHPFWRFVGGQVLYVLIILGGLILLIVPGIIWSLMYIFTPFIIIERGVYPMEALRESARITNGHKWELFLLALALGGINLLGLLCLVIGLLVSVPVSALAMVYAYRTLVHSAGAEHHVATTIGS